MKIDGSFHINQLEFLPRDFFSAVNNAYIQNKE